MPPDLPLSRALLSTSVASVLLVTVVACTGGDNNTAASEPPTFTMAGVIEPYATDFPGEEDPTMGPDGKWDLNMADYGDPCTADGTVRANDSITVTDSTGKIVALGQMDGGIYTGDDEASYCRFTFTIAEVPDTSDFYGVKIGPRDAVTFARSGAEHVAFSVAGSKHGNP